MWLPSFPAGLELIRVVALASQYEPLYQSRVGDLFQRIGRQDQEIGDRTWPEYSQGVGIEDPGRFASRSQQRLLRTESCGNQQLEFAVQACSWGQQLVGTVTTRGNYTTGSAEDAKEAILHAAGRAEAGKICGSHARPPDQVGHVPGLLH